MEQASSVVVDIETFALPMDFHVKNYLGKDEDKGALWPVTGRVIVIGMMNPDTGGKSILSDLGDAANEKGMLEAFWENVAKYNRVVTFNGRGFDLPFLMMRSAILDVEISRFDLMGQRFSFHPHCDLLEQFTNYGVGRKFTLDMYCRAFGIRSPKEGCDGSMVGKLYVAGMHAKIVEYNDGDLEATAALYDIWRKRLVRQ